MKATYSKSGDYFLPAVKLTNGTVKVIYGDPLVNKQTALKYAQIYINETKTKRAVAMFCPEHLDPDKFNWEDDSWAVKEYCPEKLTLMKGN